MGAGGCAGGLVLAVKTREGEWAPFEGWKPREEVVKKRSLAGRLVLALGGDAEEGAGCESRS